MIPQEEPKINPVRNTKTTRGENKISNGVNCPIFQKQEPVIKEIIDKINKSRGIQRKAKFALELQKEVNVLLSCQDFKSENLDCKNCHFIANLRKRTANLIIRAKRLA